MRKTRLGFHRDSDPGLRTLLGELEHGIVHRLGEYIGDLMRRVILTPNDGSHDWWPVEKVLSYALDVVYDVADKAISEFHPD
jgi:hypothetical protein